VVGPNRFPAPTNLHDPVVSAYPDGRLFHVISYGKGKMWGYADKLQPEERWHVVNYLRVLHRAVNPEEEDFQR
jgi:mono/diheme cytochrome c family protein